MRILSRSPGKCEASYAEPDQVLEMGNGKDAIVFLHGLFGTPEHWRSIMLDLGEHYRLIAPQLPVDRKPDRRRNGVHAVGELTDYVERIIRVLAKGQKEIMAADMSVYDEQERRRIKKHIRNIKSRIENLTNNYLLGKPSAFAPDDKLED